VSNLPNWPRETEEGDFFYDGAYYERYPGDLVERDLANYERHIHTRDEGEIRMDIEDVVKELNFDD
jgi:hypothetical protein